MKIKNTKIILNCLAKNIRNATDVYKISNGDVLIGLLTKNFHNDKKYINEAKIWNKELNNNLSIGLGGGDPKQAFMVKRVANELNSNHINQVFTLVGATIEVRKNSNAIVNALISPTGQIGKVKISTGPYSSEENKAIIDAETAFAMIKEMGGNSIKFFNMKGLEFFEEAKALIRLCKKYNFTFEPTGGLTIENSIKIIKECIKVNLKNVIVHIYSSIIDKKTGETKLDDVKVFWSKLEELNR